MSSKVKIKCDIIKDSLRGSISFESIRGSCTIVIFGASGDLTRRKLIPALYRLEAVGAMPESWMIIGVGRREMDSDNFRSNMKNAVPKYCNLNEKVWNEFASRLSYLPLDYAAKESYERLSLFLKQTEDKRGLSGNRIFYLAVPPSLYSVVTEMLGRSGLASEREEGTSCIRLVVEKPFGKDLKTAQGLNRTIAAYFRERQVFRIDHYLGKETVQNVLMFRFANAIFEPLWNRNFIESIGIMAAETVGVEYRAGYYEEAGVIRDMFQNHMMQLLAMTAIEPPSLFEAERVRDEKVKVFRSMRPFKYDDGGDNIILGQYAAGTVGNEPVSAYREEKGVNPVSLVPTFAAMKIHIDNWRWQGVPFVLVSGKRLKRKETRIVVNFREVPHCMFRNILEERVRANRLVFEVQPDERISLIFQVKNPHPGMRLRSVVMNFPYFQDYQGPVLDSYERVLLDVIQGEQMLFWRQDGVELCWSYLTPVLEHCEKCSDRATRLMPYEAGTWGPEAFRKIIPLYGFAGEN